MMEICSFHDVCENKLCSRNRKHYHFGDDCLERCSKYPSARCVPIENHDVPSVGTTERMIGHERSDGMENTSPCTCSVPNVSDDDILSLWRTVSPSHDQNKAMTYVKWKDGIDCDYPTYELRRLVELAMADGFKMAHNAAGQGRREATYPEPACSALDSDEPDEREERCDSCGEVSCCLMRGLCPMCYEVNGGTHD